MKSKYKTLLALIGSSLMAVPSANAQNTYWWDSNSTTAGFGNTAGTWGSSSFWSISDAGTGATANTVITSADTVNFGTATLAYGTGGIAIGIASGGVTTGGIVIGAGQNQQITLGSSGNALTIHGGGITKNAGSANFIISSPIILGAAQTWANNSSTNLSTPDGTTNFINNGGFSLTVDGTGTTVFGVLNPGTQSLSGSGALIKNGTGTLQIGGNNTGFSGNITVNNGNLYYGDNVGALGTGNINITNGIIEGRWDSPLSRAQGTGVGQIQITGGVSGFSNFRNQIFSIGTSATWGSSTFNPTEFVLQGSGSGSIRFSTAINLDGADRTIRSNNANTAGIGNFTGVISGTGAGIIKEGVGHQLFENAANSYSGATTINAGILTARVLANGGSNSSIGSSSSAASNLVIGNGATFRYDGGGHSTNRSFTINGTADGHGASLDASGGGAVNWTNTATPAYGTVDQTRTLTLTGTSTGNNILAANIANNGTGALSVNKTGTGLWILSNASNSYTGGTTLSGGTLSVGVAGNLGDASSNLVFNGGTLQITGTGLTNFASLGRANPITFTSGQTVGLDINNAANVFTVDQTLNQETGGLTKTGAGTLVINTAHTYTGVTTISGGSLRLDSGGSLAGSVVNNAIYLVNQDATTGTAPLVNIAGSGSVAAGPSATLTINTPTGLSFNALNTTGSGSFALSGVTTPTFAGLVGTTGNLSSSFSSGYTSGVTSIKLNTAGSNYTYGGVINDGATGMSLTKTGAGTQTLTGANTYTGATTINGGTLNLGGGTATGSLASTVLNLGGGTLSYTRTGTNTQAFTTTNVTAGANSVTASLATQTINMGSLVRSVGSTLDVSATGTITTTTANDATGILGGWATITNNNWAVNTGTDITGGATYYTTTTGGTTAANYAAKNIDIDSSPTIVGNINANTIRFNSNNRVLTLAAGDNIFEAGGILVVSGMNGSQITGGNLLGSSGGDLIVHGHGALSIGSIIKDNTSATALTKSGGGTLTLSGTNTFSGGVFINGGTIQVSSAANLGDSANAVTFAGNSTLLFSSGTTLSQSFAINEGVTGSMQAGNQTVTVNGPLSGSGTLFVYGTGVSGINLTFASTSNTFSGDIQIRADSGSYPASLTMNSLEDTPGTRIRLGLNGGHTPAFIYGAGAVAPLVLNNRVIEHAAGSEFGPSFNNNATLASNTVTVNTDLIFSGGARSTPFTLGGSNTGNNTFAGAITNGVGGYVTRLTKAGAGTWVLTNANTYTGGTTLTAGNLQVGVDSVGSVGSITSSALGTGTLTFNGGGISSNGAAARTILNAITFTGNATLGDVTNTGKLTFAADASLGATRTLTVNSTSEFSGIISGATFGITKAGLGDLILSGANTYTGTTAVSGGKLVVGADAPSAANGALGNSTSDINLGVAGGNNHADLLIGGAFTVGRNIRLLTNNTTDSGTRVLTIGGNTAANSEFSGNIFLGTNSQAGRGVTLTAASGGQVTFSGVIQNPTSMDATTYTVTKAGPGTVILSNANTYTGGTTVTEGTLRLGANDAIPNGSAVSIGTATLDVGTSTDTVGALTVTGNAVINLGSGGAIAFANSSAATWSGSLNITGTFVSGASIRFGNSASALTTPQMNAITVNGSGAGTYTLDADGYVVGGGIDTTPPTLTSINDNVSGGPVDINTPITYTVTFSEDINDSTVSDLDFGNAGTAPITIGAITETSPGVFTVVVTPTNSGSVQLRINQGAVIEDTAPIPNALDTTSALLDNTTINVRTIYESWANTNGATGGKGGDPDGDGFNNLMEFAFDTNPTTNSAASIAYSGGLVTAHGQPILEEDGGIYYAVFGRRVNYVAAGLTYTVQFSAGLDQWTSSAVGLTTVATDGVIDAIRVPFPNAVSTPSGPKKPTFFRVVISE